MSTSEIIKENFNELFRAYIERGGTQKSLAAAAGVAQGQVSTWMNSSYMPRPEAWDGLCRAFLISPEDLLRPGAARRAFGQGPEKSEESGRPHLKIPGDLLAAIERMNPGNYAQLRLIVDGFLRAEGKLESGSSDHQTRQKLK